jgi:2-dehydropantoate 2-reductase
LFYGAGVIGSVYAARLKESGQDVSILARGDRLTSIREQGIVLEDVLSGKRTNTSLNVVDRLAPEDSYDLVVVCVRPARSRRKPSRTRHPVHAQQP